MRRAENWVGLFVVHRSPTSLLSQYSQRSKRCFQTGQMRFHVPNTEVNNPGYIYSVYPLEGVWTTTDGSRGADLNKAALAYRLMIKQPEQVTPELFKQAQAIAIEKKGLPKLSEITFEQLPEAEIVQAIHIGSFDTESDTFAKMDAYLVDHQLKRVPIVEAYWHREVYLSDFRRVAEAKRKTLLRYRVEK